MADKHAVVRTDNLIGTDVREQLYSVRYMGANGDTATAIENGNVVVLGDLIDGTHDVYVAKDVAADTKLSEMFLIASVENVYDERKKNLSEFINEAGANCRAYKLHSGAIFSVTAEALSGTPAKGNVVSPAAGTKLAVAASSSTAIGKIIDVEVSGQYTYYVIKID